MCKIYTFASLIRHTKLHPNLKFWPSIKQKVVNNMTLCFTFVVITLHANQNVFALYYIIYVFCCNYPAREPKRLCAILHHLCLLLQLPCTQTKTSLRYITSSMSFVVITLHANQNVFALYYIIYVFCCNYPTRKPKRLCAILHHLCLLRFCRIFYNHLVIGTTVGKNVCAMKFVLIFPTNFNWKFSHSQ